MPGLQGNSGCPAFFSPGPDEEAYKGAVRHDAARSFIHQFLRWITSAS